jgi:thymidylate synthase (FAD)
MGDARVLRDARFQDPKNRQNSIDLDPNNEQHRRLNEDFRMKQAELYSQAQKIYSWAIENGIAKEQARVVLPEGNTKTRLYMNGTLRSWIHYIELRGANGTQKEHMEIAHACAKVIAKIFPLANDLH